MTLRNLFTSGVLLAAILLTATVHAVTIPPNDGFVTDEADVLSEEEEALLETDLAAYRSTTTNEIAIVILPSLDGEVIADAAVEIGRSWGVGSEKDNGILMLIDYGGREVFLATGYGLEGAVPDIVAKGIVEKDMVPAFREGEYGQGISAAVASLKKHIAGEYTAQRYDEQESGGGIAVPFVFFFFVLLQWVFAILSRTKSWWLGGVFGGIGGILLVAFFGWWLAIPLLIPLGLLLDYLVSKNFNSRAKTKWWAGGGWGPGGFGGGGTRGGGGSGFGGFGGGSFGGGGAGGKW